MCLVALAIGASPRFPLVIVASRDEHHDRPTQPLDWWQPEPDAPPVLGGRDLLAGGTWLGLSGRGRLALLTNVREPQVPKDPDAPSRGHIVPRWLRGDQRVDHFWMRTALEGHGGFNLIVAELSGDPAAGDWHWMSNRALLPRRLLQGVHAVSNASLDTPWPKVVRLKRHLHEAVRRYGAAGTAPKARGALVEHLFAALQDAKPAADDDLPATGIPLEAERWLSPAFIRSPDGSYGTRSSTVIVVERDHGRWHTRCLERTYARQGPEPVRLREAVLSGWPGTPAAPGPVIDHPAR